MHSRKAACSDAKLRAGLALSAAGATKTGGLWPSALLTRLRVEGGNGKEAGSPASFFCQRSAAPHPRSALACT